ncbi:hypothetical protein VTH8203_03512 [Vibrio thalassae]|uniref:Uncharacterized protein n=1 Tax=Vibrio thalassae TaxID=1243014 RepID=A0A240EMM2_9VIBR|nr:hypothetical protein VTH8203_03512 [Vibrio thalassae]
MNEIVGIEMATDDYKFDIFKCEQAPSKISADPINIWFPAELVELQLCSLLNLIVGIYKALLSCSWRCIKMRCTFALTDHKSLSKACRLLNQFTYTQNLYCMKDGSTSTYQRGYLWSPENSKLADTSRGVVA